MSIYISGVEMPKEHPLYITLRPGGSVHVWDSYGGTGYGTQAISVPPHGRLIDADALVQVLKFVLANPVGFDGGKADVFAVGRTIQLLEEAQTIIEADKEGE